MKLPSRLSLDIDVTDNTVALRWECDSWEEARATFLALKTMSETGAISVLIDNIEPRMTLPLQS